MDHYSKLYTYLVPLLGFRILVFYSTSNLVRTNCRQYQSSLSDPPFYRVKRELLKKNWCMIILTVRLPSLSFQGPIITPIMSSPQEPPHIYGWNTHFQYGSLSISSHVSAGKNKSATLTPSNLKPLLTRQSIDVSDFTRIAWDVSDINHEKNRDCRRDYHSFWRKKICRYFWR